MYDFMIVALLGLAVLKLTDLVVQLVPKLDRGAVLLRFAVAVAGVVALDYSLFAGFDITVREPWMGLWATGLIVGAMASVWNAMLAFLGSGERALVEPATQERPRIAA